MNKSNNTIPIHIKKNLINVVMRQTDYNEKLAETKLEHYNYEVMDVIRNFMNPDNIDKKQKNEDTIVTNVHQQKFTEIRNMMDDATNRYRKQKEIEEYRQQMYEQYLDQRNKTANNLKNNIK
tara:strand:+ start:1573 stop:1938 length:366 start_codon:yes stop_codon:yes gene_type:complete